MDKMGPLLSRSCVTIVAVVLCLYGTRCKSPGDVVSTEPFCLGRIEMLARRFLIKGEEILTLDSMGATLMFLLRPSPAISSCYPRSHSCPGCRDP